MNWNWKSFLFPCLARKQKLFELFPMQHILQKCSVSHFHMCMQQHINSAICEITSIVYFGNHKIYEKSVLVPVHLIHCLCKRHAQTNIPKYVPLNFEAYFPYWCVSMKNNQTATQFPVSVSGSKWQSCANLSLYRFRAIQHFGAGEFPHLLLVPLQATPLTQVRFEGTVSSYAVPVDRESFCVTATPCLLQ